MQKDTRILQEEDAARFMKEIGLMVRKARHNRKLSQGQIARIIKCDKAQISRLENGRRFMSYRKLVLLFKLLDIRLIQLRKEDKSPVFCPTCLNRNSILTEKL